MPRLMARGREWEVRTGTRTEQGSWSGQDRIWGIGKGRRKNEQNRAEVERKEKTKP